VDGLAVPVSNGVVGGSTSVAGGHGMCCGAVASGLLMALENDGEVG
jgi:ABC-type xylose transport system permease subunit